MENPIKDSLFETIYINYVSQKFGMYGFRFTQTKQGNS